MIQPMKPAGCGARISRTTLSLVLFTLFSAVSGHAEKWDSEGAMQAFQEARQKRGELAKTSQPKASQYLECAKAFRKVYVKDPHFGRAGDAIYEEGLVYQEMGDKFRDPDYYRTAARRFQLLVSDYGGNQNCPDALMRLATIYFKHLNNESAAREAYQRLRTQYGYSKTPPKPAEPEMASKPVPSQPSKAVSEDPESKITGRTAIHSIRYWSATDYTRVIIDMDLDTRYEKFRLTNPDRLYFDIANARLNKDLQNRTFNIGDGFLRQVRVAQFRPDVVRVVLDFSAADSFSVFELHEPFRVVIDLQRKLPLQAKSKSPSLESAVKAEEFGAKATASGPSANTGTPVQKPAETAPYSDDSHAPRSEQTAKLTAQNPSPGVAKVEPAGQADTKSTLLLPPPPSLEKSQVSVSPPSTKTGGAPISSDAKPIGPPARIAEARIPGQPAVAAKTQASPSKELKPAGSAIPSFEDTGAKNETKAELSTKLPPVSRSEPAATPKPAAPTSHGDRTLTRVLGLKISKIVIDPGHGGHDLGTVGPGGLAEKDLVLSLARILKRHLEEKLGTEVILTRNDDTFIPLEERTEAANNHRADLFISLHANSSSTRSISGVETYYLSFARTDAERQVAARENASAANKVGDLEELIKKIMQQDKAAESRELASIIQKSLYSGLRQLSSAAKNRGVRSAPFIVLIGANMPSVLVETAFISNPKDEKLLTKNTNQELLVKALYNGIESYIKTLGSEAVPVRQVKGK
jgi:N-acetylmuramoyl-L-alanine amidase